MRDAYGLSGRSGRLRSIAILGRGRTAVSGVPRRGKIEKMRDIMARSKHRAYKADYAHLFDAPASLFGAGTETILWPNGSSELWLRSTDGMYGFAIKASNGPAGFGLTVRVLGFGRKADILLDVGSDHVSFRQYDSGGDGAMVDSVREVEIVQYRPDERSQAFRAWYRGEGEYPANT